MKKKYDENKRYKVSFRDEEARSSFWTHIHCYLVNDDNYKKNCYIVYQEMMIFRDAFMEHEANGGFINYIKELDKNALSYLNIEESK